jgi:hypothetical protein
VLKDAPWILGSSIMENMFTILETIFGKSWPFSEKISAEHVALATLSLTRQTGQ